MLLSENFQLALLTAEETIRLNKMNRSTIDPQRLKKAGIRLVSKRGTP